MAELKYDIIAAPEGEPLVLSGPPQDLTGRVELHNPGKVNVVIRDAGLNDPSGVLISRPLRHALPTFVLHPDQGRSLPLTVALDKKTPPGVYHVDLDLAGRSRSAVLNVTEVFDLRVQPKSFVVGNLAGMVQRKQFMVANEGNVAFTIGDIGQVDLKDDMVWDRTLRLAVEQIIDRTTLDIEELVVAVLRVARENAYRIPVLKRALSERFNERLFQDPLLAVKLPLWLKDALDRKEILTNLDLMQIVPAMLSRITPADIANGFAIPPSGATVYLVHDHSGDGGLSCHRLEEIHPIHLGRMRMAVENLEDAFDLPLADQGSGEITGKSFLVGKLLAVKEGLPAHILHMDHFPLQQGLVQDSAPDPEAGLYPSRVAEAEAGNMIERAHFGIIGKYGGPVCPQL